LAVFFAFDHTGKKIAIRLRFVLTDRYRDS